MSNLKLKERAADAPMSGLTLGQAIGEALGAASVCWDENGVFLSDRAVDIQRDLEAAIRKLVQIGINQGSVDAKLGIADFELTAQIFAAPALRTATNGS